MDNNFLLVSLDDEKSKNISEVLGSKSCKSIIDLLTNKNELSESDIAKELKMPLNTVGYNIEKLLKSGLIEKSKHWWSVKGKKIEMYKLSNKYIVIAPKSSLFGKIKNFLITGIFGGIIAVGIYAYEKSKIVILPSAPKILADGANEAAGISPSVMSGASQGVASNVASGASAGAAEVAKVATSMPLTEISNMGLWFLSGVLFTIILILVLNWKKLK